MSCAVFLFIENMVWLYCIWLHDDLVNMSMLYVTFLSKQHKRSNMFLQFYFQIIKRKIGIPVTVLNKKVNVRVGINDNTPII